MNNAVHYSFYAKWECREYKVNICSAYYGKEWYGMVWWCKYCAQYGSVHGRGREWGVSIVIYSH